jgi:hypothetical protein
MRFRLRKAFLALLKKLPDEKLAWLLAELKRLEEELKYTVH